jgi:nucleoside-diphosphate-sugar epimerase
LTGATGYIGSYLINYLKNSTSHDIIALSRKLPDYFEDWRKKFEVVECDVTSFSDLKRKVKLEIDLIIHLAAFNNIRTFEDPNQALDVNGGGTRNMLEIAKGIGCKSFIYFSTLQVYGKELYGTITVDSEIRCQDDYAFTHFVAEGYCEMFNLSHGINVSILRPSNIFGRAVHPKIDRWSLVPACFCLSSYKENRIILGSSGKQNRDFISLDFVSKCTNYLIDNWVGGINKYNISSENLFSILEIAELVKARAKAVLNKDVEIIFKSKYPMEVNKFLVKNNLLAPPIREELNVELKNEIDKIFIQLEELE